MALGELDEANRQEELKRQEQNLVVNTTAKGASKAIEIMGSDKAYMWR